MKLNVGNVITLGIVAKIRDNIIGLVAVSMAHNKTLGPWANKMSRHQCLDRYSSRVAIIRKPHMEIPIPISLRLKAFK